MTRLTDQNITNIEKIIFILTDHWHAMPWEGHVGKQQCWQEEERGKNSGKNLYGSSFIMVVYCGKEWVRQGKQAWHWLV